MRMMRHRRRTGGSQAERVAAARFESPERVAQLRAVWQAGGRRCPSRSASDVARSLCGAADLILFDAKTPKGALPGGMGLAFDWSLLAGYRGALPWGLAGGLNPTNVAEAIARTGAPLVDTSSGVESAPALPARDGSIFISAQRSISFGGGFHAVRFRIKLSGDTRTGFVFITVRILALRTFRHSNKGVR